MTVRAERIKACLSAACHVASVSDAFYVVTTAMLRLNI